MTAGFLRRLPIRQKLTAIIMTTAAAVLTLAGASYLVWDYYHSRWDLTRDLLAQAHLVLTNSTAAVSFNDPAAARETLQTLAIDPHVLIACLYDGRGALFADYRRPVAASSCPSSPGSDRSTVEAENVELLVSAWDSGRRTAAVYVRSDLRLLWQRLRVEAIAITMLLALALAFALVLSSRLQKFVADPVTQLAATATAVSGGDYSLRASKTTEDELGALVDAFNRMLDQIQARERDLSRANEDLRREVAERQRAEQERASLLVREREANRLKDEFLATLSHELRTPLNAILGWTRLLRVKAVPDPGVDRALEKVERNAQVQARLVEDLLEVSRITTGKLHLEWHAVDLVAVVNAAIESIRPSADSREVTIEKRFAHYTLPTVGDPDRLQQIVWNLLSNAVKFSVPGGSVTITLGRDAGLDELVVEDTGIGIDPRFLPSVFDTFRQADASATRRHGGLGLGLSIVRRLVELHGGQVEAFSEGPDRGARFTVRLPVRSGTESSPADETVPRSVSDVAGLLQDERILVVDDEPDTLEMLRSVLSAAGAHVLSAASADEALRLAVEWRPRILVSDIGMPAVDGYMLLEQIRATLGADAPHVAIALTAYAGERDRARALAVGYQRHVPKPFDPLALVGLISELSARAAG